MSALAQRRAANRARIAQLQAGPSTPQGRHSDPGFSGAEVIALRRLIGPHTSDHGNTDHPGGWASQRFLIGPQ